VAVRQTVTLTFDAPLQAGSYLIELAPAVQAAAFNDQELTLLAGGGGFAGHPVVALAGTQVVNGSRLLAADLVRKPGGVSDLGVWHAGTPFLTQLHDDLGALLDGGLTQQGDVPAIPVTLNAQILDRFSAGLGPPGQRPTGVLVIWLDPVSCGLQDPQGLRIDYSLKDQAYKNDIKDAFCSVAGNVEVVVIPTFGGKYILDVADVPARARAGAVYLGADNLVWQLTDPLRAGQRTFAFDLPLFGSVATLAAERAASHPATEALAPASALVDISARSSPTSLVGSVFSLLGGGPVLAESPLQGASVFPDRNKLDVEVGRGGTETSDGTLPKWLLDLLDGFLRAIGPLAQAPAQRVGEMARPAADESDDDLALAPDLLALDLAETLAEVNRATLLREAKDRPARGLSRPDFITARTRPARTADVHRSQSQFPTVPTTLVAALFAGVADRDRGRECSTAARRQKGQWCRETEPRRKHEQR
jgi:hypothetical protein